jgi:hypothetical protein
MLINSAAISRIKNHFTDEQTESSEQQDQRQQEQ